MARRPVLTAFNQPPVEQRFLDMLNPAPAQVTRGRVSPPPYPVYGSGPQQGRPVPPYMDMAQLSAMRAQAQPKPIMPLEAAAMRGSVLPRGPRVPQQPTAMQAIGDAFKQPLTSPTGQGLAAAAMAGLEYGGPSMKPTSLGQGLARMGAAGMAAYAKAEDARLKREAAQRAAELDREYKMGMLGLKEQEIAATRASTAAKADAKVSEKQVENEMKRAGDFRTASKGFDAANLNYGRIVANATTPNPTGATDIAMIFNFMKMLDPTSVVRGSEYEAAAGAGSLLKSLGVQYNRLFNNEDEKLDPAVRRMFLQTAAETFVPYTEAQRLIEEDFALEAEAQGFRLDRIITKSRIPDMGSKDFPHLVYSEEEGDSYPKGSFVMMDGVVYEVQ